MNFPKILHHYTSPVSFYNIIENKSLWLSDDLYLNDTNEGDLFNEFSNVIEKEMGLTGKSEILIEKLKSLKLFVFCLSSKGDVLSQWRAYANDGAGFSIGFNSEAIKKSIKRSQEALLIKVNYADSMQELPEVKINLIKKIISSTGNPRKGFIQSIVKERWAIKNHGFREEDEYRLVINPANASREVKFENGAIANIKFRATNYDVRNYIEFRGFQNENNFIQSVTLGPKNQSSIEVIKEFLNLNGFINVKVLKSSIPYR